MKKNLFAIEIAVAIILITTLLTGIFLDELIVTWIAVSLIVLAGLTLVTIKIVNLAKEDAANYAKQKETNTNKEKKHPFLDSKKAWQYSSTGEKIKSLLFVFTLLICCIAFIVLCSYGYIYIALIVLGSGISLIVISLIVMAVIDRYLYKKHLKEQINEYEDKDSQSTATIPENESITTEKIEEKNNTEI